jgi:hypothetical protein
LEQEPVAANSRRVVALAHEGGGGLLQVIPEHGFRLQAPAEQPYVHVESFGVYEQVPPLHVPIEE